jgi:hypothetical protein
MGKIFQSYPLCQRPRTRFIIAINQQSLNRRN